MYNNLDIPNKWLRTVLPIFADSIEFAHQVNPQRWGLTPDTQNGIMRLNVGLCEVLTLDRSSEYLYVFVNRPLLEANRDVQNETLKLETDEGKDIFPSSPGSGRITLDINDRLEYFFDKIREAHYENIKIAAKKSRNPAIKVGHRDWAILEIATLLSRNLPHPDYGPKYQRAMETIPIEEEYVSTGIEGNKTVTFTTRYERDFKNREDAIKIHGVTCMACKFNFQEYYGEHGRDYIHVHHNKPLHALDQPMKIDSEIDLEVLCPNCHAMVHREKLRTLSLEELRQMISKQRNLTNQRRS